MTLSLFTTTMLLLVVAIVITSASCKTKRSNDDAGSPGQKSKTYVCIGTSAAGLTTAKTLKELEPQSQVICFSDEQEAPYNKCKFHSYVASAENTPLPSEYDPSVGVDLRLGMRVIDIDANKKVIMLADGSCQLYDKLFIGTGAIPHLPSVTGLSDCKNVFVYYNLAGVDGMQSYLHQMHGKEVVVVGTGLSGLECADALHRRGMNVTIISRGEHVLAERVDANGSMLIKKYIRAAGVNLETDATIESVQNEKDIIQSLTLSNGKTLPCGMLVIAYGATLNNELAYKAGVDVVDGAIKVDDSMMTSNPDIYAGGDIAMVRDNATGQCVRSTKWSDAKKQGVVAAHNMVGQQKQYEGAFIVNGSSFFGLKVMTCGPVKNVPAGYDIVTKHDQDMSHTFIVQDGVLKGFCLVWDKATQAKPDPMYLKSLIISRTKIDAQILVDGKSIFSEVAAS